MKTILYVGEGFTIFNIKEKQRSQGKSVCGSEKAPNLLFMVGRGEVKLG